MDGVVEELLRLEGVKHKALIEGRAPDYDQSVRAQLHLLDSTSDLEAAVRQSRDTFAALARLTRQNTSLYLNLLSTSSIFASNCTGYTSAGNLSVAAGYGRRTGRLGSAIAVEA